MDNERLDKCIAQGNGLVKICTALHERLAKVEAQNAKLIQINTALVQRVVELEKSSRIHDEAIIAIPQRIDDITAVVNNIADNVSKRKTTARTPRDYKTYKLIADGLAAGKSLKGMSKEYGIPYTTVSSYAHMDDDEVAKLPRDDSDEYETLPQEQLVAEAEGAE